MEEEQAEPTIAEAFSFKRGTKKTTTTNYVKKKEAQEKKKGVADSSVDAEKSTCFEEDNGSDGSRVRISMFDYSVENHFRAMDTISELCGKAEEDGDIDEDEIKRLSSSITFLREWRNYNYEPRDVKFACEVGSSHDVVSDVKLHQFSSATVPNKDGMEGASPLESSRDFVMYVGGPVWGLDWCPRVHEKPDRHVNCEFIAVSAHPPGSSYHKMGLPLTGRGVVQIWCLVHVNVHEEEVLPHKGKPKPGPKKNEEPKDQSTQPKRPRGRPRKMPIEESVKPRPKGRPRKKPDEENLNNVEYNYQNVQLLAVEYPVDSSELLAIDGSPGNTGTRVEPKNCGKKPKTKRQEVSTCDSGNKIPVQRRRMENKSGDKNPSDENSMLLLAQNEDRGSSVTDLLMHHDQEQEPTMCNNLSNNSHLEITSTCSIPDEVALPRLVLCLAHNGKVAWDVKWRPPIASDSKSNHRMGYLAVLLGNGSLEVWEVPLPHTIKTNYSSAFKDGTDPRFVKLEPVFRCSKLKCGGRQSIPLTVEWSTSSPHDYLLAGCHDGTVALWRFSLNGSFKDTRPLLCFSADTVPIRAVAWAPADSGPECSNLVVTAGHGGLKFWDLRDPFRSLWYLHPVPRIIYSLDWLPNPRCVVLTFDDGTMRTLSLLTAAYDLPVTGKPLSGARKQVLSCYNCSSFTIWSVQVSRLTGMAAYCIADGTVLRFQLTSKAVEKGYSRDRTPHFLCGSLTEEESTISINTPSPNTPISLKKPVNKGGEALVSMREVYETGATLALCNGDNDPEIESGSASQGTKKRSKEKTSGDKNKKVENNRSMEDEEKEVEPTEEAVVGNENERKIESLPSKNVAVHRVRWNMNNGSERWLCSGGAAGILRCQEIVFSDIDKKLASKR